jgi:hypothetical protein
VLNVIRRLHRAGVDRVAELPWLRERAGARASWAHYERHARAWHRAQRLAGHPEPRALAGWQAAVGRIVRAKAAHARPGK